MVKPALQLVSEHSGVYCVVKAASQVTTQAKEAGKQLGIAELEVRTQNLSSHLNLKLSFDGLSTGGTGATGR